MLPRVLQRACQELDASRATLLRLDGEELFMEGVHDVDGRSLLPAWHGPLSQQPLFLRAAHSGRAAVGKNIVDNSFPDVLKVAFGDVKHSMVVPLPSPENAMRFMAVFRRSSRPFNHDDSATLQLLAHVALVGMRNARLYADAQAASQAM
jgi:GAF domain-containing protein